MYEHDVKSDIYRNKSIQRLVVFDGKSKNESVTEMHCGNTVAVVGIDSFIVKSGTLITSTEQFPHAICGIKLKFSQPVVPFRETVLAKSPNSHNQFTISVEPLDKELLK